MFDISVPVPVSVVEGDRRYDTTRAGLARTYSSALTESRYRPRVIDVFKMNII